MGEIHLSFLRLPVKHSVKSAASPNQHTESKKCTTGRAFNMQAHEKHRKQKEFLTCASQIFSINPLKSL